AVDAAEHRVYAVVDDLLQESGGTKYQPVAANLVAWSTQPEGKALVRAEEKTLSEEPVSKASLISSELLGTEITKDLYAPEGIVVEPSSHDVVVEGQEGVVSSQKGGPTNLERITTNAAEPGNTAAR